MKRTLLLFALLLVLASIACAQSTPAPAAFPPLPTLYQIPTTLTPAPTGTITLTPTLTTTLSPSPIPSITPSITPTPIVAGPFIFPDNVNPLTGLPVSDPKILDRLPVMIKVANYPAAGRPHAGLSFADLVFEYYIGAGANRFNALYYGQDSIKVGPVRSARMADVQLASMYRSILGFKGADRQTYSFMVGELGKRAINGAPATCPGLCDDGRKIVTSFWGDSGQLSQYASKLGINNTRQDLGGMYFDSRPPAKGQPGTQLAVLYHRTNRGEWRYDPATGKYLRWIESLDSESKITMYPLTDLVNGQQLAFANVVVLYTYHILQGETLFDLELWHNKGGRRAVLFRDGQAFEGIWQAADEDQPIRFYIPNAGEQPLPFKPGNTWMVLTGVTSAFKQPAAGQWELYFHMP